MPTTAAPGSCALAICGEFTIFTAATLKEELLATIASAPSRGVEIDLSNVSEIDSAGLQLMVMAKRDAADKNKSLRFINHSSAVLDLIDLCDLTAFFGDPILIRSKL